MTAPEQSEPFHKPSSSPPGPNKQEGEPAPANLLGVDDGDEDHDEAVVFEGGAQVVKDNPAVWGSSETNIVDQGAAHTADVESFPDGLASEETVQEPGSHPGSSGGS